MPSYEESKKFADRFLAHQAEIAQSVLRVDVAPIEEDQKRNTDLILRSVPAMRNNQPLRFSARVRTHGELRKRDYKDQFTLRYRRPSGVQTEWQKMRAGDGDYFIYGFEAEAGSDRMHPWFIGNLAVLNDWIDKGGKPVRIASNDDGSSDLAIFDLNVMPVDFVSNSEGHPVRHFVPPPTGLCHRWMSSQKRWCGAEPIGRWQVGPLCGEHAPESHERRIA